MAAIAKKQRTANDLPWLVGLGVLAVIGLAAWLIQLTQGFGVLGVNQSIVWGAYIATFFLLAGTGSGLVIFAALGDLAILPAMKAYRRAFLLGRHRLFHRRRPGHPHGHRQAGAGPLHDPLR